MSRLTSPKDQYKDNSTATCINRGTLKAKGDAYKIFIDQTVQFLKKSDKAFFNIFKSCIEAEVESVTKNEVRYLNAEKALNDKKKGETEKTIKNNNSTESRQNPEIQKEEEESQSGKEEHEADIANIVKENKEFFETNFTFSKSTSELCKIMTKFIKQKVHTKGKKIGAKAYSPAQKFCENLCHNLGNENMRLYFKTLVENCTFWTAKFDYKKLPVVYPQRIRMHSDKEKEEKKNGKKEKIIDNRGFMHHGNPIREITKKKKRGRTIFGDFNYKGLKLDQGFEACHIWYDTTEAPPLFTFIPNVVWMPQIISRLSDKVVKNTVFPPLLKYLTDTYYDRKTPRKLLKQIISGTWQGLIEQDDPIYSAENVQEMEPRKDKFSHFYVGKELVVNTTKRIKKSLDYIDKCKKIAKETKSLKVEDKKKALYELYKKEKKRRVPVKKGEETKAFQKWEIELLINQWEIDPELNPEGKFGEYPPSDKNPVSKREGELQQKYYERRLRPKCRKFVEDTLKQDEKEKLSYTEALKKMIIESYVNHKNFKIIYDLETWLKNYYKALTTIDDKKKKQFLKDIKNGTCKKDLGEKYRLSEEELNRNIGEILGSKCPNNVEDAHEYLSKEKKNIDVILKETQGTQRTKSRVTEEVSIGEEISEPEEEISEPEEEISEPEEEISEPEEEQPPELNLNDFIIKLCNKQGIPTEKVPDRQKEKA